MNLLFDFKNKNDSFMYKWMEFHIFQALLDEGHYVYKVDIVNEDWLDFMNKENINLYFTTSNHENNLIQVLKTMKQKGIKTVLFCPDNAAHPRAHLKVAKYFDLVWLSSKYYQRAFYKKNKRTIVMPYASTLKLYSESEKIIRIVVFIGNPYGSRLDLINALTDNGIGVDIYNSDIKVKKKTKYKKGSSIRFKTILSLISHKNGRKVVLSKLIQKIKKNSLKYN